MSDGRKETKTRYWATIVYPESAPKDWEKRLEELHIQALISPLHCDDVNPDGTPKKPHHHVIIMLDGPVTSSRASVLMEGWSSTYKAPEYVKSLRGYARYLCHLDNPEKAQYSPEDIREIGGVDYQEIIGLPSDKYLMIEQMQDFCDEQGIRSYAQLSRYARKERKDWWRILCDIGSLQMYSYLKSASWEDKSNTQF